MPTTKAQLEALGYAPRDDLAKEPEPGPHFEYVKVGEVITSDMDYASSFDYIWTSVLLNMFTKPGKVIESHTAPKRRPKPGARCPGTTCPLCPKVNLAIVDWWRFSKRRGRLRV